MTRKNADILIDARLIAYRTGGISRYVQQLCEWLPKVAPDLPIMSYVNRPTDNLTGDKIRVFTPPHFRFERYALGAELAFRSPRLVHSPDFIAPMLVRSRRIITVHDLSFLSYPEHLSDDSLRYYRQIDRSLNVADRVIAVSEYTADQLRQQTNVNPSKVVTVLNGADHEHPPPNGARAREIVRQNLDQWIIELILSGRPIILSVGTVEPRKRQQLLLRAMQYLEDRAFDVKPLLLIVGRPGWSCDEIISDIARAAETRSVIWLDSVDDELLGALYRLAAVLAIPSIDEGFGLPVLEAMRAELPVVAANRGALSEIAGDAAVLVDDDEPEPWGEVLAAVISDENRRNDLIRKGLDHAQSFTWKQTACQTAEIYREVLNQ